MIRAGQHQATVPGRSQGRLRPSPGSPQRSRVAIQRKPALVERLDPWESNHDFEPCAGPGPGCDVASVCPGDGSHDGLPSRLMDAFFPEGAAT